MKTNCLLFLPRRRRYRYRYRYPQVTKGMTSRRLTKTGEVAKGDGVWTPAR